MKCDFSVKLHLRTFQFFVQCTLINNFLVDRSEFAVNILSDTDNLIGELFVENGLFYWLHVLISFSSRAHQVFFINFSNSSDSIVSFAMRASATASSSLRCFFKISAACLYAVSRNFLISVSIFSCMAGEMGCCSKNRLPHSVTSISGPKLIGPTSLMPYSSTMSRAIRVAWSKSFAAPDVISPRSEE